MNHDGTARLEWHGLFVELHDRVAEPGWIGKELCGRKVKGIADLVEFDANEFVEALFI